MLDYKRTDRIGALMQREISDILQRQIKDPRVGFCTVTHVEVSNDLRHAKVRVSIMGDENQRQNSMAGLKNAAGFIRREIGQRLSLRYTPEIRFIRDKSVDYILTVDKLLKEIETEYGKGARVKKLY
ncbi:TPA: 30S ribosome-binding factor RbfA [Candidatus Poribacteria bacterium]|nr:30S ribosome-binding factor RbfA [Candidatus Poribacteria bacterium]